MILDGVIQSTLLCYVLSAVNVEPSEVTNEVRVAWDRKSIHLPCLCDEISSAKTLSHFIKGVFLIWILQQDLFKRLGRHIASFIHSTPGLMEDVHDQHCVYREA